MSYATERLRNLSINKTAGLSFTALRVMDDIPRMADTVANPFLRAARKLGKHFRVSPRDAEVLLNTKRKELPKVILEFIPDSVERIPFFDPTTNVINTYREPWSFMHEYAHAGNRKDILTKLNRFFNVKTKIKLDDYNTIVDYLNDTYGKGNRRAQAIGQQLFDSLNTAKSHREQDTMKFIEELRANAKAYFDTKQISGRKNAIKVFQPLSINDMNQDMMFRQILKFRG